MRVRDHWDPKVYEVTGFLESGTKTHTWFEGDRIWWVEYRDRLGRKWYYAWGKLKPEMKTRISEIARGQTTHKVEYVDALGGQSWHRRGDVFICCYKIA